MRDEPGAAGQIVRDTDVAVGNTFIVLQPCSLQQDLILYTEQSSERSSQEDWAMSNPGALISHGSHDVSWTGSGGLSSHGSIGAAGKGSVQEQACTSASRPRCSLPKTNLLHHVPASLPHANYLHA